jgi:hypothetical protein
VYAFGVVLLEIMTGRAPFHGMSSADIRASVIAGERPALPDSLSPTVRGLVAACWAQDPADRPNFEQVTTRLEDALSEARDGWNTTTTMIANHWG